MYASKENARKARELLLRLMGVAESQGLIDWSKLIGNDGPTGFQFIECFLIAAERKLPTEAAYRRAAKPRKRTKLANG